MRIQHLIDGHSVESSRYFETVNPATQDVLAEVAQGGAAEVDAAVAAAEAAFPGLGGTPAPGGRRGRLPRAGPARGRRSGPGSGADSPISPPGMSPRSRKPRRRTPA